MMETQDSLGLELLWVAGWGIALTLLFQLVSRLLDIVPLGDDRRAGIVRAQPLIGLLLAFVFSLFSVEALFSHSPSVLPYSRLFVLGAFFVGGYPFLRDFFAGIAIRSEESCRKGDQITIGGIRGKVADFLARGIALETPEGDSILVPYSRAASLEIVRTPTTDRGASYTFTVPLGGEDFPRLKREIERAALLHHFTSIARSPEIALRDGCVEVTLFVVSLERAPLVEAAVLHRLQKSETTQ